MNVLTVQTQRQTGHYEDISLSLHSNGHSTQSNLLCVPSYKLNFGACSFRVAAPTVWNSLPADIRACTFYGSFTRQMKTYFNNAF